MPDPIREELHKLLDHVPEADLSALRKFVRALVDPAQLAALASRGANLETEEERRAVQATLADPYPDIPFEQARKSRA